MFGKKKPENKIEEKEIVVPEKLEQNPTDVSDYTPEFEEIVETTEKTSSDLSERVREYVFQKLDPALTASLEKEELSKHIFNLISNIADEKNIRMNLAEQTTIVKELLNDIVGVGPIQPLMEDDEITDIMVNGYDQIYVERKGKLELTDIKFRDKDHVHYVAQRIANAVGRRIDESNPMVDARLPDGSRVNAIASPLSLQGTCLSIRKFSENKIGLEQMVKNGSMSGDMAELLKVASKSRLNILVSGGTGAGKTSVLNALSKYISHSERIVTIEDAAELRLEQPHVLTLETRNKNTEGRGEVTQSDLIINALRMRPDRIIMGEVRGKEAIDMLQAMNTGHEGSMSTLHANNPRDSISRLENMLMMGTQNIPMVSLRRQIASSLDLVIQAERMRDGSRRIVNISDICGMEGDTLIMADLFTFDYKDEEDGKIIGDYTCHEQLPSFYDKVKVAGFENELRTSLNLK